jgi:hypothetical protein
MRSWNSPNHSTTRPHHRENFIVLSPNLTNAMGIENPTELELNEGEVAQHV